MKLPTALSTVSWLVRDTFRQSRAAGVFWLMLVVSLTSVALCLSVRVVDSGDETGHLELAGGAIQVSLAPGRTAAVHTLEGFLAGWVADGPGLLLALLWTAGFLPSFLEPGSVSVLLAKPIPRWSLLVGKALGAIAFVALQDALFLGGTWLALGLRTGVWDSAYLCCLPLLLLHFAVFFSFSAMLATQTRSTTVCVFGSLLFWLLCWGMNLGRHILRVVPEMQAAASALGHSVELAYWVLPKPLDCHLILMGSLQEDYSLLQVLNPQALASVGAWQPTASLLASCAGGLVLLALAAHDFMTAEY
jgi:hypothetical protein